MGTQNRDTAAAILEASRKEFMEYGYEKASLRRIAKEASVTTGAIYGYFAGKDALFAALTEDAAEELVELVDAVGMENVGICWDLEHASIMKQDQPKAMKLMGKRLKVTHVSDQTGGDNIHVMPFQGVTDWNAAMEALADIGYEGNLNFEAQWFLNKVPMGLVMPSLRYSVEVGNYLIELFEKRKAWLEAKT